MDPFASSPCFLPPSLPPSITPSLPPNQDLRSADAMALHAALERNGTSFVRTASPRGPDAGYLSMDGQRREKFLVIDARPQLSARANQAARGMGFENTPQYKQVCRVLFMGVSNIHVIRKSWDALEVLCRRREGEGGGFGMQVENTRWLFHLHKVLAGALLIAHLMHHHGVSLLVHCSDGWDRTAQLCATAQLLMDPFYRTLTGFQALIHKDWVAFGHNFTRRNGLDRQGYASNERAPIFVQWLDVVHQILRQFPNRFQFTEGLLLFLARHAHAGWTGDFLYNCERERTEARVTERSISIFALIDANRHRFLNPAYQSSSSASSSSSLLTPVTSSKRLVLWEAYFFSWQTELYELAWRQGTGHLPA
ncbi:myotubularin related protein 3 [Nannochloropsis gaditana]|uniref:Myotubularin related protein 3 n=1 Tax=Nannochloropsis gaditana TaxID=72520 RepID=W7TBB0_9STRA|nr:myotubularin related protein 3 [Nannochloropsis gaditana]